MKIRDFAIQGFGVLVLCAGGSRAQEPSPVTIQIKAGQVTARVSPMLYGLMTEEINYSYDGGIYGELVRNRSFKEDAKEPVHWQLVQEHGGAGSIALDPAQPLNDAVSTSLKLTVTQAGKDRHVGIANEGFWGIPVHPDTRYRASFYAKAAPGFAGPLTVALVGDTGGTVRASAQVAKLTAEWHKYEVTLTSDRAAASAENRLLISASAPGTVWFSMVSLFPPTWSNRPNGNRKDIMQILADMKPAFLRFPGGNYLEGNTLATRFDWKKTIGDIAQRPGHQNDSWRYWSSDGMGLLEFLEWCEDLHMQPVLGVYAGFGLRGGVRMAPGPELEPYVKEALEEIEYVTGSAATTWGARRAKDGHPAPFPLEFVEVGNEDQFDRQAGSYDGRFAQFFDAIRAKYPQLKVVATTPVTSRTPDVIDEHYYRRSEDEMAAHAHDYDARPRTGPKVFVGEWATRVGDPTPTVQLGVGPQAPYKGAPVLVVTSDAGIAYSMFELDTAAKYKIPVVCIVYNNNAWGMWPSAVGTPRSMHLYLFQENLRYDKMAEGLGARGEYVRTQEEFRDALKRSYTAAANERVSSLINVQALKEFTSARNYPPGNMINPEPGVGALAH